MSLNISISVYKTIEETYGAFFKKISGISAQKATNDLIDIRRAREQIDIIKFYLSNESLERKKMLEIGSGYGILQVVARKEYSIDAWGIEPSSDGFDDAFIISQKILRDNDLTINTIVNAHGENLPFPDNSFDIVYSTNVLEHVKNPQKVIQEAIRVCKRGGIIQIVAPNYGSFFDGHYACFYIPYQPKWLWKFWLKYFLNRDPSYVNTLRTNINYFTINHWLKKYAHNKKIKIISLGEDIFEERIKNNFSPWGNLQKVKSWVNFVRKLKLTFFLILLLRTFKAYTPFIITIRKY